MPKITTEGEATLFFSANEADKSWRLKEKVVAVIESYLQERDDILTFSTNKKFKNVAGGLEQIDVLYTNMSDPTEYFSFVEVRDRDANVGKGYIQQIMGKRISLGVDTCKVVSTKGFTRGAILLASHQNIPLRELAPETEQNIKRWFKPDVIQTDSPVSKIVKCSVLARIGGEIYELKAEQKKVLEHNILVPTAKPHKYKVISLSKVFSVDVEQNSKRMNELLANIPTDGMFHKAPPVAIQYKSPKLYLRIEKPPLDADNKDGSHIFPIEALVFFVMMNRQTLIAKITERYKYLDAISKEKIAELVLASFKVKQEKHYICLTRYNCDDKNCQLGGAFFR